MLQEEFAPRSVSRPPSIWPALLLSLWIAATFAEFRRREVWDLWGAGGFDAQVIFQIVSWTAFGVIGLWLLATGRADLRLLRSGPLFWYCGFVALALISTLYSASPLLTLYRSVQLVVAVVLVISLRERLTHLYTLILAYVAVNWILFLLGFLGLNSGAEWLRGPDDLYVSYGGNDFEAWRFWTAFGHPSQIAIVAGIAAIGLAARTSGRQWMTQGPLIAWLLLTVMLTVSRTAIAATFLGLCLVAASRRALLPVVGLGCALLFFALLMPETQHAAVGFLMRGQSAEEFASLTGRVQIYSAAVDQLEGSWLLGHGFRAARVYGLGDKDIVHAHNLILEVWHGLGLLGVVMACAVVLASMRAIYVLVVTGSAVEGPVSVARAALAVHIPVLAFCIMDSGFAVGATPFLLVFLAVLVMVEVEQQRLASRRTSADRPDYQSVSTQT
jgi:O-antigen ligase